MAVEIKNPIITIGIGGVGAKIASQARSRIDGRCILMSNDKSDLNYPDCEKMLIDVKNLLNPSSNSIRGAVLESSHEIRERLGDSSTVILIGNLAGNGGTGMVPLVARMAMDAGKNVISFVVMPFKFETSKLFKAGVSLRRLKESSNCLIIVDNDALLYNNPDLTVEDCYRIINEAVLEVIGSLTCGISLDEKTAVLCTSKDSLKDAESALKDSFRMLYTNVDPDKVSRAVLYVVGGDKVRVGILDSLVNSVQNILGVNGTEVGLTLSSSSSDSVKVLLMASVLEETRFDDYDPLNIIPNNSILDWDEIECSLDFETDLPRME